MKFNEITLTPENHFIAMEYYGLILNRTFFILITKDQLIGIKVNGMIGVKSNDAIVDLFTFQIDGDLNNPYAYIVPKYLKKIQDIDLTSDAFLKADRANFRIPKAAIVNTSYDKTKKWGMGYYPHDGKVYVKTQDRKREFIILASQSGQEIERLLRK